jgi:hypothetical protein
MPAPDEVRASGPWPPHARMRRAKRQRRIERPRAWTSSGAGVCWTPARALASRARSDSAVQGVRGPRRTTERAVPDGLPAGLAGRSARHRGESDAGDLVASAGLEGDECLCEPCPERAAPVARRRATPPQACHIGREGCHITCATSAARPAPDSGGGGKRRANQGIVRSNPESSPPRSGHRSRRPRRGQTGVPYSAPSPDTSSGGSCGTPQRRSRPSVRRASVTCR